jgi:hypothetical protein
MVHRPTPELLLAISKHLEYWKRLPYLLYFLLFIPSLYITTPLCEIIQVTLIICPLLPKKESEQRTPQ